SQERMLLVVKTGRESAVERIFEKWDLHAVRIGEVTDNGLLRVKNHHALVAEIPNRALTDEAPVYRRPMIEPEYLRDVQQLDLDGLTRDGLKAVPYDCGAGTTADRGAGTTADRGAAYVGNGLQAVPNDTLLALLASPTIASKKWIYRQYDHMVRTNT